MDNEQRITISRREALKYAATIMGGTIIGAEAFLTGCTAKNNRSEFLSEADVQLLDEIGETILPESSHSPGAKAAQIGAFMNVMVADCYSERDQNIFLSGLDEIRCAANEKYGNEFLNISPAERLELLSEYDRLARQNTDEVPHFFAMMKQLTILGYFTSQPGVTQAMRYDPVPGGYNGCVEYKPGDKAWYGPLSSIG